MVFLSSLPSQRAFPSHAQTPRYKGQSRTLDGQFPQALPLGAILRPQCQGPLLKSALLTFFRKSAYFTPFVLKSSAFPPSISTTGRIFTKCPGKRRMVREGSHVSPWKEGRFGCA